MKLQLLEGTSKNHPQGDLTITNTICALPNLETDICYIRNFARVPIFREPLDL